MMRWDGVVSRPRETAMMEVCSKTERLPSSKLKDEDCCRQPQICPSTSHLAHHTRRVMREFTPLQQLQRSIWRHRAPISHHPARDTDTNKTLRVLVHAHILISWAEGSSAPLLLGTRPDVWPRRLGPAGSGRVAGQEGRVWSNSRCNRTISHDPR